MAKTKISEYSSTANSNTDIASINIDEGCAPSGINNAIRALMAQIHDLYAGSSGDTWPVTAGGTGSGTASGARTNLGLVIGTDVQAYDADLAAIASSEKGAEIASYGTYGVGFKNRIINGAMMIDQRNAGASVANVNGYSIDRWASYNSANSFSAQRSTTAPAGFTNSLLFTTTTSATPGAADYRFLGQFIEGFNVADLGFGAAGAQTVTLSFWVRSSLTGTFSGALKNSAENRSYPFTFTISSANTFEYKTITVSGDTSGTWLTDNGIGLRVYFDLGSGSSRRGTAGSWSGSNFDGVTGSVSLVATLGATFYITGVQLEKGSTATSFDYRPYGTELALCQRYYIQAMQNSAESDAAVSNSVISGRGFFPVTMRATPTISTPSLVAGGAMNGTTGVTFNITTQSVTVYQATSGTAPYHAFAYWTYNATAEL